MARIWQRKFAADFALFFFIGLAIILFFAPIFKSGQIVFSDLDFGWSSEGYLNEIWGIWNYRWSTPSVFNIPRLMVILPPYMLGTIFGDDGTMMLKSFILLIFVTSGWTFAVMMRGLIRAFFPTLHCRGEYAIVAVGAFFYAVNPWAVTRIQHIYLLVGYAFIPLHILLFLRLFHPHFRDGAPDSGKLRLIPTLFDLTAAIAFAMAYTLSSTSQHYFVFSSLVLIPLGIWVVLSHVRYLRRNPHLILSTAVNLALRATIAGFVFLLLNFYWLGPTFYATLTGTVPSQNNVNTPFTIDLFSRNGSLENVLLGISYWWPMFDLAMLPRSIWWGGGILLMLSSFVIFKIWNPLIRVSAAIIAVIALAGTGTYYLVLRPTYLTMVFDVGFPLGNVIRDPNKLIGVNMLFTAVIFVLGSLILVRFLQRFMRWYGASGFVAILLATGVWLVIQPFHARFVQGFYDPIKLPPPYQAMTGFLKQEFEGDDRVLYFPIAQDMVHPQLGYPVPEWNITTTDETTVYRATPNTQVHNTPVTTLFHEEGAAGGVAYFYTYVQQLLDDQSSLRLGAIASAAGADGLVYRDEYPVFHERQAINLQTLLQQSDLEAVYENDYLHVFETGQPPAYAYGVPHLIYTVGGYSRLDQYTVQDGFQFDPYSVIFLNQEPKIDLSKIRNADYVDGANLLDLLMTVIPADHFLFLPQSIDPETGWHFSFVQTADFHYKLSRLYLENFVFDFDYGQGIVYTDETAVVADVIDESLVSPTLSFEDVLAKNLFYSVTEPITLVDTTSTAVDVSIAPLGGTSEWYIVQTLPIPVDARQVYRLSYTITGDNIVDFHMKARFLDEKEDEISTTFFIPEDNPSSFENLEETFIFDTPADTKTVVLQALAHQHQIDEVPTWQFVDLAIDNLADMSQSVTVSTPLMLNEPTAGTLFIRTLNSRLSGSIQVGVDGEQIAILTKSDGGTMFKWVEVGDYTLEAGEHAVSITNISGFNAVNALAFVPRDELGAAEEQVYRASDIARNIVMFDAETDFRAMADKQLYLVNAQWAGGRAVPLMRSGISTAFEIIDDGDYAIKVRAAISEQNNDPLLRIRGGNGEQIALYSFDMADVAPTVRDATPQEYVFPPISLDVGQYTMEVISTDPYRTALIPEMFTSDDAGAIIESITESGLRISYVPKVTDNWHIITSDVIPVDDGDEYYLHMGISSDNVRDRHVKARFYDQDGRELLVKYLTETSPFVTNTTVERPFEAQIIAPEAATAMKVQVLVRVDEQLPGWLEAHDIALLNLSEMPIVDTTVIYETNDDVALFPAAQTIALPYERQGFGVAIDATDTPVTAIALRESPSPLWRMRTDQGTVGESFPLNGVSTLFFIDQPGELYIETSLDGIYRAGLVMLVAGLLIVLGVWALDWRIWRRISRDKA